MDGVCIKENQQFGLCLLSLFNVIVGGFYIGLFGIVLGIMVVFFGIVMVGDVNINVIVLGMVVVLLVMVMGLFVVIFVLFGYNCLVMWNKEVSVDMWVFVDEFVICFVEVYGESQFSEVVYCCNGQLLLV